MRSRLRRVLPFLVAGGLAGTAVLVLPVVLGSLGVLTWFEAVTLTGMALLGGLLCGLGAGLWLLLRSVRRLSATMDGHTRRVTETLGSDRLELTRSLEATRKSLARSLETNRVSLKQIKEKTLPQLSGQLRRSHAVESRESYQQQVAWTELREYLDTAPFMPPLRGWAASPDVLRLLVHHIDRLRPELVVEFGSGASSVWLGYALRRAGGGLHVAIEHDARYAELSRELVAAHGLADVVEIRHAPLTGIESTTVTVDGDTARTADRWYDRDVLADLEGIGLVFIDGPPGGTGLQARYPALPSVLPHCTEDVVIVLDDADRPDERAAGDRWLAEYPELRRTEEAAEKGAHVFSRKGV